MTIDVNDFNSLQDVEQYAAEHGIRFTKGDYNKIRKAEEQAKINFQNQMEAELEASGNTLADKFQRGYPKLLNLITNAGNVVITLAQSVIVNLGVPSVLVLLLIVEQQRVYHGIELFEVNKSLAAFGAFSLVVLNLVLEFIAHHVEYTKGYEADGRKKWSLKIGMNNLRYRLGWGDEWKEQELSPAQWAHSLLRIVTFTILSLALVGSMKSVIQEQSGTWYEAMVAIAVQSSLIDMMTWIGGLLFAVAAVLSAQGLSRYVAIRTVEIRAEMSEQANDGLEDALDQASATAAYAVLIEKLNKKASKEVTVNFPVAPVAMSTNGNGAYHQNGNGSQL